MAERSARIPESPGPFRLGRHVVHDERSKGFRVSAPEPLRTVNHRRYGTVLDQDGIGACTGFTMAHALMSRPMHVPKRKLTTEDGFSLYSRATELDPWAGSWRPDDTGSSGLAACKAAQERELITSYRWAFGLEECLSALVTSPVMVGSNWHRQMYWPASDGTLTVSGDVVGGHEYLLNGLDVRRRRVRVLNSWGADWGIKGMAWLSWDDLGRLLEAWGDCVVPQR